MPLLRLVLTPAMVVDYADLVARTYNHRSLLTNNPGLNYLDLTEFFYDNMTIYGSWKVSS